MSNNFRISKQHFKVLIKLKAGYQLDVTESNFHELIGFNRVVLKDAETFGSQMLI